MKRIALRWLKGVLLLALLMLACARVATETDRQIRGEAGSDNSRADVRLRGQTFSVEIVESAGARRRGLMHRQSLATDRGMLFVYPNEAPRAFWMKNTRIPLDIFYFDSGLRLVSVVRDAQPCLSDPCPDYPSEAPARYVLELNAGAAARLGVQPGDRLITGAAVGGSTP